MEKYGKVVRWFKEEVGDREVRKQKLLIGLSTVKERFVNILDAMEKDKVEGKKEEYSEENQSAGQ